MSVEALWYEVSPYAYCVVGLVSAAFSNSDFGFVFSALLLTASFAIVRRRRLYRRPDRVEFRKYAPVGAEALLRQERARLVVRANQLEATSGPPETASTALRDVDDVIRTGGAAAEAALNGSRGGTERR